MCGSWQEWISELVDVWLCGVAAVLRLCFSHVLCSGHLRSSPGREKLCRLRILLSCSRRSSGPLLSQPSSCNPTDFWVWQCLFFLVGPPIILGFPLGFPLRQQHKGVPTPKATVPLVPIDPSFLSVHFVPALDLRLSPHRQALGLSRCPATLPGDLQLEPVFF